VLATGCAEPRRSASNIITQPLAVIRDTTPPTVTFHLPGAAPLRFAVVWRADDACGVQHYEVAYKTDLLAFAINR